MEPTEKQVEAAAQAYAEAWRRDLGKNLKRDVPTWAEMSEPQREAMRRCTRPALEDAEAAAWRPMEEAPKDGSGILGYVWPEWIEGFFWNGETWCYLSDGDGPTKNEHQPTHWRPLPPPPDSDGST
jgi:hypothetical protein